jgi:anti-sigma-K factor RskA
MDAESKNKIGRKQTTTQSVRMEGRKCRHAGVDCPQSSKERRCDSVRIGVWRLALAVADVVVVVVVAAAEESARSDSVCCCW